jgi:hypothetical protein
MLPPLTIQVEGLYQPRTLALALAHKSVMQVHLEQFREGYVAALRPHCRTSVTRLSLPPL